MKIKNWCIISKSFFYVVGEKIDPISQIETYIEKNAKLSIGLCCLIFVFASTWTYNLLLVLAQKSIRAYLHVLLLKTYTLLLQYVVVTIWMGRVSTLKSVIAKEGKVVETTILKSIRVLNKPTT